MPKSILTVDLKVKDLPIFKKLVELLEKHYDDLPIELQENIKLIAEYDINDFTADDYFDYIAERNLNACDTIISTGNENIIKINKALKKVFFHQIGWEELEHFSIKNKEHIIIEW